MISNLGVHRGSGAPQAVVEYEGWLGRPLTHVVDFCGKGPDWSKIDNPVWWCNQWKGKPWKLILSTAMLPNTGTSLAAGARGDYDSHWKNFFRVLVANGQAECVVRLGWEFNGKFYPWAAGGKEGSFTSYWRRIVGIARQAGFKGAFMWCPLAGNTNANVEAAYPGDAYVDIIGLDAYDTSNVHSSDGARWNDQLGRPYGITWFLNFTTAHNKPRAFPEWGLTVRPNDNLGGGDNPYYIEKMAQVIAAHDVQASYFEVDASDATHRLMNNQFPKATAKFLALFGPSSSPPPPPDPEPVPEPVPEPEPTPEPDPCEAIVEELVLLRERVPVLEGQLQVAADDLKRAQALLAVERERVSAAESFIAQMRAMLESYG